jgi:hypothetical protein
VAKEASGWRITAFALALVVLIATPALANNGKGGGKKPKPAAADTAAPSVSIQSPGASVTVSKTIQVQGMAADNVGVVVVDASVDTQQLSEASGTTSWSWSLDTTALPDGTHTITARALDAQGNAGTAKVTVTVDNVPNDTTAPKISIATPADGATAQKTITVGGTASDDVSLAAVSVALDGASVPVSGTVNWSTSLDTTTLADGSHTIVATAKDATGNTAKASVGITVQNATSASTSSGTSSGGSASHLVTPEGVTIDVNTAGSWTAQQIYDLLKANAIQLGRIGPSLTIKVQDTYASQTATGASQTGSTFTSFSATMYLQGINSAFAMAPDQIMAHEYGHVWSLYHLYMTMGGDWSSYLSSRWTAADGSTTLATDPRLDTTYSWNRKEIIADDYRLLFGSSASIAESPNHMNRYLPQPSNVTGLRNFLLNVWGA